MHRARSTPLPLAIPAVIALAWCIALFAQITGSAAFLHHHTLIERGPPIFAAVALFLCAWLIMIAAMMLPSSLPLMRLFAVASSNQDRPAMMLAAFLGGYALVWLAFGLLAFAGDVGLHRTVDRVAWLGTRPWLIGGGVLALAGLFQFSPLKDACLRVCRSPGNFLLRYYGRGGRAAFELGYRHGIFCAGCCWALMLVSFAAGFASLWWMAALTALMVYEKIAPNGRRAVPIAGVVLLAMSVAMFAHPSWFVRVL
jgi:predicted metal-binding membrane protein